MNGLARRFPVWYNHYYQKVFSGTCPLLMAADNFSRLCFVSIGGTLYFPGVFV